MLFLLFGRSVTVLTVVVRFIMLRLLSFVAAHEHKHVRWADSPVEEEFVVNRMVSCERLRAERSANST